MTKEEAIKEECSRYIRACIAHNLKAAHRHLRTLHRLAVNGYTNWDTHWKERLNNE